MTYVVAVARAVNSALERYGRPRRDPEALRAVVAAARETWAHVAIVRAAELEQGLQARTVARRLEARPPDDPALPLALPPEGQRLRPGQATVRLQPRLSEGDAQLARDAAARAAMRLDPYLRDAIVVTAAEELGLDVPHYLATGERVEVSRSKAGPETIEVDVDDLAELLEGAPERLRDRYAGAIERARLH